MHTKHPFLGRSHELSLLQKRYEREEGQLALVYGRRRIGKSFLLERFAHGKPVIFHQASLQTEETELAGFTDLIRSATGSEHLPEGYRFPTWETALVFLAARHAHSRLLVILDEFPYLVETTPALPSLIQRWWDQVGKTSGIMLVLCGSAQAFMESLDAQAAPLHQRFTAKLHIGPLGYRDAALFMPNLSAEEKARVYGILGGTPFYLRQWDQRRSLRENILELFADPASSLVDSAELVLSTDLQDARAPYRALQAVALGASKHSEIRDKAKLSNERILARLLTLGFLEKRTPATEHPERTKRGVYVISDNYFRFYFRFIAMNRGQIARGLGKKVIDGTILPLLDDFMGAAFESMACEFVRFLMGRGALPGDDVGSWWSTDGQHEIDLVGTRNQKEPTFIGSVKWRSAPLGDSVLADLERDAPVLGVAPNLPRILIGRGGLAAKLMGRSGILGYSIEDLYAE
ncbi:MAG TPA: ATP-binding protein [Candidatus Baltobacteraceae bacterium]|jgi:hypothetical protein|nr:ATP-binding protein [Candidatus Baltobacteraceae bacterium]